MTGTAKSKGEAILPGALGFENAPVFFFADLANAGERIDEGFFLAKVEEGEIGTRVAEAVNARIDAEFGESANFFVTFVIFTDQLGEEIDVFTPVKSSPQTVMEAEHSADSLDPQFGAGGREDELVVALLVIGNFFEDLGVGEFGEPFGEKSLDVLLESGAGHSPKIAVKNALHPTGAEDFDEGKESDEDEGKEASGGFLAQNVTAKNKLGVPGDDRLIEIKKDVVWGGFQRGEA